MTEHLDVLVVGAGLAGIAAGYHLQLERAGRSFAIFEARNAIGGTWDLFRYPGIRSDSDMQTFGYAFRPWRGDKIYAGGAAIRAYIEETAREFGIDQKIRFGHRVERASWSSDTALWTVEGTRTDTGEPVRVTCRFLLVCSGYYDYAAGYTPELPGIARFHGPVVHPQAWTDDIDFTGKRVAVVGSGATAATLVPALAEKAARVTMLQRSPSYVVGLPGVDPIARFLNRWLHPDLAYGITRWKNVTVGAIAYAVCRRFPAFTKRLFVSAVRRHLGDAYDVEKHFTPRYDPWDQRPLYVPDGDLFRAIKEDRVEVVTDQIETFTETGVALRSGRSIDADLIVTATGLRMKLLGGMSLVVDGRAVDVGRTTNYRGAMLSDVPNMAVVVGYTNASWTLKTDLVCGYVCRLLNHMDRHGYAKVVPRVPGPMDEEPAITLSSGYVHRALAQLPKQGKSAPWRLHQNYFLDLLGFRYGRIEDGALELAKPHAEPDSPRGSATPAAQTRSEARPTR